MAAEFIAAIEKVVSCRTRKLRALKHAYAQFTQPHIHSAAAAPAIAGKAQPGRGKAAVVTSLIWGDKGIGIDTKKPSRVGIEAHKAVDAVLVIF